ncbi:hypothetical protein TRVA0_014S00254 [Trichomonascus vanleenenianus]|uniref:RNA methyltransferase n=1 Tax=Trichomonascus vanleenenianus TaxID=2268995 RepID=UPI003EC9EB5C
MSTVTLAIPASSLDSRICRSQQQATHLAHQIARAAAHYGADEIVVFEVPEATQPEEMAEQPKKIVFNEEEEEDKQDKEEKLEPAETNGVRLSALLQYFITPSYLRTQLFGKSAKQFQYAKKLPKLPGLPFLNRSDSKYLEGVTVRANVITNGGKVKKYKKGQLKSKKVLQLESMTNYVNVGRDALIKLDDRVPVDARVTVDVEARKVVSPKVAYADSSTKTFGYVVRLAPSFGKIFTESSRPEGYSYTVYVGCNQFITPSNEAEGIPSVTPQKLREGEKQHLLLVFGRWAEVDGAVKSDEDLAGVESAKELFDARIESRSGNCRVEDAVLATLAKLE